MTKFAEKFGLLLAIGTIALVATPSAFANAELTLSDGTNTVTVTSANCGTGCYLFNGTIGQWNINVTTGTTAPGQTPELDLNTINHHAATTGTPSTLTIQFSANGYTPPASGFELNIGGTVGTNGKVTAALYGGTTNTLNDLSNQIGTTLSFSNPPISFSGTESAYLAGLSANPYGLTEVTTIFFGSSAGQASFDYSVDAIPEPAGVLLLGTAILFSVSAIRRKVGNKRRA